MITQFKRINHPVFWSSRTLIFGLALVLSIVAPTLAHGATDSSQTKHSVGVESVIQPGPA